MTVTPKVSMFYNYLIVYTMIPYGKITAEPPVMVTVIYIFLFIDSRYIFLEFKEQLEPGQSITPPGEWRILWSPRKILPSL